MQHLILDWSLDQNVFLSFAVLIFLLGQLK